LLLTRTVAVGSVAVLQAIALAVLLWLVRRFATGPSEEDSEIIQQMPCLPATGILVVVTFGATRFGQQVTTIAGRKPAVAATLLPMVMIVQILFSVPVVSSPEQSLPYAYEGFTGANCAGRDQCPHRDLKYWSQFLAWLCDDCRSHLTRMRFEQEKDDQQFSVTAEERKQVAVCVQEEASEWGESESAVEATGIWRLPAVISYGTLTRYADILMRTSISEPSTEDLETYDIGAWRREAWLVLSFMILAFPVSAAVWMWLTVPGRWKATWEALRRAGPACVFWASLGGGAMVGARCSCVSAQDQELHPADVVVRIPLRQGAYRADEVRAAAAKALRRPEPIGEDPRVFRLGFAERLALVALERAGKLRFKATSTELELHFLRRDATSILQKLGGVWGLHRATDLRPERPTVLFAHGLEGSRATFLSYQKKCGRRNIQCLVFDYPNDHAVDVAAQLLVDEWLKLARDMPNLRISVIAHSMGGLVVRRAFQLQPPIMAQVDHVLTLGTPYGGTAVVDAHEVLELLDLAWRAIPGGHPFALDLQDDGEGEAVIDLRPGSELLQSLSRFRPVDGPQWHTAAGSAGPFTDEQAERVGAAIAQWAENCNLTAEQQERMLAFLQSDELRRGKGDGAVTVRSALPTWADTRATFDANHLTLLSAERDGDESPVFQWAMSTLGW